MAVHGMKVTARRRKIQSEVERWSQDHNIRIGPADPSLWALIEMVERLDSESGGAFDRAVSEAYERGFGAGQGRKG